MEVVVSGDEFDELVLTANTTNFGVVDGHDDWNVGLRRITSLEKDDL